MFSAYSVFQIAKGVLLPVDADQLILCTAAMLIDNPPRTIGVAETEGDNTLYANIDGHICVNT